MKRKMLLPMVAAIGALILSGCSLSIPPFGSATPDGLTVKVTIVPSMSTELQNVYFQVCHGQFFPCYWTLTTSNTSDPTGQAALEDCNPLFPDPYFCGQSEIAAIGLRAWTDPFQLTCLTFQSLYWPPDGAYWYNLGANYGSWGNVVEGTWNCP